MFDMTHNFAVHVVRADGTSYTKSNHRVARWALRSLRELGRFGTSNHRSAQVWCASDNKSYDEADFAEALRQGFYGE